MSSKTVLVHTDSPGSGRLVIRPAGITSRLLARLFGLSLDRRLAIGEAPESGRLLAVRAQQLVALRWRRELAHHWERLLGAARRPQRSGAQAWLSRDRILAAEADVRELAIQLRTPLPVRAAGVAAAHVLLTDATGPLYNRRDGTALTGQLREISAQLDPGLPLQSLVRSKT
ncbi:MAG TPA: hypothetical protein VGG50_01290 [Streptosporangiaceae bacterium]|jgi:hypothetical protein